MGNDKSNMELVRGRKPLTDEQVRNLQVGGTCVLNGEWQAGYIYKNSAGELVVTEVEFSDKMRA